MRDRLRFPQDTRENMKERHLTGRWLRAIVVFVVGLVIGYIVFGLWLFPVAYTSVYPNELRPEARDQYLDMVAQSYAARQDMVEAAMRLQYWSPEELGPLIYRRAETIKEGDPVTAELLLLLAETLQLTATGEIPDQASPTTASETPSSSGVNVLRLLVAVGLILLVIFLGPRLLRRFVPARQVEESESMPEGEDVEEDFFDDDEEDEEDFDDDDFDLATDFSPRRDLKPKPEQGERVLKGDGDDLVWEELAHQEAETAVQALQAAQPLTQSDSIRQESDADGEDQRITEAKRKAVSDEPAEFKEPVTLRFDGDPEYNEVIPIEDGDTYLGEYGLSVVEKAPESDAHVLSLEVWLFDKKDIHTVAMHLMPPTLYADVDVRERLAKENDAVALEVGRTFSLTTQELILDCKVLKLELGDTMEGLRAINVLELETWGRWR